MLLKHKLEKVKSFIDSDNVLTKLEERYCYATDASNNINKTRIPDLVVFVESIEDVQKIVKYANTHEIPIIPRGAGTNMVGACLCPQGGIVLNFSKMNKILEISTKNMLARVQPGAVLGDVKITAEKLGLFFPPDPSNYKVSTIGGAIAQSSGGAQSFKYGTIKDYILSLKVITANGDLMTLGAETMKDASGYHLNQLIIGSEGTLAVVVEAVLKLIPKPEAKQLVLAYFDNIENATEAVDKILINNISPAAIDFMDRNSIKTVEDYAQCGLDSSKTCLIIVELDGTFESVRTQAEKIKNIFQEFNSSNIQIPDEIQAEKIWQARRSSFAAASRLAPDVISDDIIVPRKNIAKIIRGCSNICKKYNLQLCLVGHIGDGNIHPQIVLNLENEIEFKNYQSAKSEIYRLTQDLNGTISAEHGVGIEKMIYLENTIDKNALEYMKLIKKAFDPKNILNPGKIFKL
ncbi:MAG: FAD-binding protein [Cyanobacteria bacterium SIG31]|nr:FAD-binding protein [Cyanobacteria bacterium SIG31]